MRGRGGGEVNVMPLLQRLWKGGREQGERGWREGGSGVRGQPEQASAASFIGGGKPVVTIEAPLLRLLVLCWIKSYETGIQYSLSQLMCQKWRRARCESDVFTAASR